MSDFGTLVSELKEYSHKPGDETYLKKAIERALWEVRSIRCTFSEGEFEFVTANDTKKYDSSTEGYPADVLHFDTLLCSTSQSANQDIAPNSLEATTNLSGTLGDVDEDPDDPDANWLTSDDDTADTIARLGFGTPTGTVGLLEFGNHQTFQIWTRRTGGSAAIAITVELYESGSLVAALTASPATVTSDTGELVTAAWDANDLSDTDGTDVEIRVTGTSDGTNTLEYGAFNWVAAMKPDTGTRLLEWVPMHEIRVAYGWDAETLIGPPYMAAFHHEDLFIYPVPGGKYVITGDYFKDATLDEAAGTRITENSANGETNEWFRRGRSALINKCLSMYHMEKTRDVQAANQHHAIFRQAVSSLEREHTQLNWKPLMQAYI